MPIEIVDYDPAWPHRFEEEKSRIIAAIGSSVVSVEHVGSTAIPGVAAKPIIDIMAGLRSLAEWTNCVGPLEALGYEYVPSWEVELPERRYFRRVRPRPRTHHIHMVETTSEFWRRQLLFRDHLRAHQEDAREYEALKRHLATRFESGPGLRSSEVSLHRGDLGQRRSSLNPDQELIAAYRHRHKVPWVRDCSRRSVQTHVRKSDVVARFGGDEFLVLQPEATVDAAAAVATVASR